MDKKTVPHLYNWPYMSVYNIILNLDAKNIFDIDLSQFCRM